MSRQPKMDLLGEHADAVRELVEPLARSASAHTTSTPTNGVIVWRVPCPYCSVVVEWTSRDGHPPVEMLRHDLFNHIFHYHPVSTPFQQKAEKALTLHDLLLAFHKNSDEQRIILDALAAAESRDQRIKDFLVAWDAVQEWEHSSHVPPSGPHVMLRRTIAALASLLVEEGK